MPQIHRIVSVRELASDYNLARFLSRFRDEIPFSALFVFNDVEELKRYINSQFSFYPDTEDLDLATPTRYRILHRPRYRLALGGDPVSLEVTLEGGGDGWESVKFVEIKSPYWRNYKAAMAIMDEEIVNTMSEYDAVVFSDALCDIPINELFHKYLGARNVDEGDYSNEAIIAALDQFSVKEGDCDGSRAEDIPPDIPAPLPQRTT